MKVDLRRNKRSDQKCAMRYRVIADGRDVTDRCFFVDGRLRRVGLYLMNGGSPYIDLEASPVEIAKEWIHPKRVRLVRRAQ